MFLRPRCAGIAPDADDLVFPIYFEDGNQRRLAVEVQLGEID
jgi:hypothetical protein